MGVLKLLIGVGVILFIALPWIFLAKMTNDVKDIMVTITANDTAKNTTFPSDYFEQFELGSNAMYFFELFLLIVVAAWIMRESAAEES